MESIWRFFQLCWWSWDYLWSVPYGKWPTLVSPLHDFSGIIFYWCHMVIVQSGGNMQHLKISNLSSSQDQSVPPPSAGGNTYGWHDFVIMFHNRLDYFDNITWTCGDFYLFTWQLFALYEWETVGIFFLILVFVWVPTRCSRLPPFFINNFSNLDSTFIEKVVLP